MRRGALSLTLGLGLLLSRLVNPVAAQEVKEIAVAQQFGAIFIPLMAMEHLQLIEGQARAHGIGDLKVSWARLAGPSVMVDAILSGNLHFSAQGVPSLSLMWDRTRSGVGVKAVSAITNTDIYLNTRNPNIKSIRDFTDKDRIAVPSVKVSTQALFLQIAAEQEWGPGQHGKLDHLTVGLAHPDAIAAVLNPLSEISAHFATSPFHEAEMKAGLRTVISGYEIMGGPTTGVTFTSYEKFRVDNPRIFAAVNKAFDESLDWINADKRRAARLYIEMTNERKLTEDDLTSTFSSKDMEYTKVPSRLGKIVDFLHRIGFVKNEPAAWTDLFFQEAHGLPGS